MRVRILKVCLDPAAVEPALGEIEHFHWQEDYTGYEGWYDMTEMLEFLRSGNEAYVKDPRDTTHKIRIYAKIGKIPGGKKCIYTAILPGQETDLLLTLPRCE